MQQARTLANELMSKHGLLQRGWKFAFDRAKARCGQCDYTTRVITLSRFYVSDPNVPSDDIRNTILHEIAHVLAGDEAAHGPLWKRVAVSIGCDGATTNNVWRGAQEKYKIQCRCGKVNIKRYRLTKKYRGSVCASCRTLQVNLL